MPRRIGCVALHPYSPDVKGIEFQLKRGRAAWPRVAQGRQTIYLTEEALPNRRCRLVQLARRSGGTGGNCVLCESFGLLGADGSSKPAFGAYVGFTGGQ